MNGELIVSSLFRMVFVGQDAELNALGILAAFQGRNHPLHGSPDRFLDERGQRNVTAVDFQLDPGGLFLSEKSFFDQVHNSPGIVQVKAGHANSQRLIGGDGQKVVLLGAEEFPLHLLAKDFNLGLKVSLEPLGENDVHILNVPIPELSQVGVMVHVSDDGQFLRGGDEHRMGPGLFMAPTVFAFPVHLKPVDIVFYRGHPIATADEFRNELFDQSRLPAVGGSNDGNNGDHKSKKME